MTLLTDYSPDLLPHKFLQNLTMVTGHKSIRGGQVCLRRINVTARIGIFTSCRQKLKTSKESEQHKDGKKKPWAWLETAHIKPINPFTYN